MGEFALGILGRVEVVKYVSVCISYVFVCGRALAPSSDWAYFSASLFFSTLALPPRIFAYFGRLPKLVIHTINEARQQLERFLPPRQAVRTRKPKLRGVQRIDLPTIGQVLGLTLRLGLEMDGPGLLRRQHRIHAYKDVEESVILATVVR